jgi:hypothetical protein
MTPRGPDSGSTERESTAAAVGPVQVLVIGFEGHRFTGEILPELRRLQEADLLRVIDLLVVVKDETGDLRAVELSGLSEEERMKFGAVAGALIGLGPQERKESKRAPSRERLRWQTAPSTSATYGRSRMRYPPDRPRRLRSSNIAGRRRYGTQSFGPEEFPWRMLGCIRTIS